MGPGDNFVPHDDSVPHHNSAPHFASHRSSRFRMVTLLASAALFSGVLLGVAARGNDSPSRPAPQISVQVNVVSVPVTVTDGRGDFVRGLGRGNFRLRVDGVEQPIKYFAAEEEPAQALVLVETGPAVYLLAREHVIAATELLEGLDADDRVAIASYSDTLRPLLDFTTDKRQAAAALETLNYGLGMANLNFYDNLAEAVDLAALGNGKQAIVLLTTGLDSSGPGHWEQLLGKLRQSNVMVLAVALGGELRETGKRGKKNDALLGAGPGDGISFAASDRALESIAAETGGTAFFPKSDRDFQGVYRRIAALVRHEYSIGFDAAARDGRYHDIQVDVVDDGGRTLAENGGKQSYRVNTRRGFLAPLP
jgi:Ca-activated chloride channel homolog